MLFIHISKLIVHFPGIDLTILVSIHSIQKQISESCMVGRKTWSIGEFHFPDKSITPGDQSSCRYSCQLFSISAEQVWSWGIHHPWCSSHLGKRSRKDCRHQNLEVCSKTLRSPEDKT